MAVGQPGLALIALSRDRGWICAHCGFAPGGEEVNRRCHANAREDRRSSQRSPRVSGLLAWLELVAPLVRRLVGYRQVTDALLLGLAIRNEAILVTLDRTIHALAGEAYAANLLTLA